MGKFRYGDKVRSKENAHKIFIVENIVVLPEGTQFINDMFYENDLQLCVNRYHDFEKMAIKQSNALPELTISA